MITNNYARKEKTIKLWKRCLFTFLVLVFYRVLCTIPTPGINKEYFNILINANSSLGFLNVFSGNNLSSMSIMALNITPYISSTIIVQLLERSLESLKRLSKGTPKDKKKISVFIYVLTGILAFIQSIGMAIAFGKDGMLVKYSILWVITISVIWTSSSVLLAIISQKIDKNKNLFIGKGISLLLLTNILSSFPSNIKEIYMKYIADKDLAIVFCILGILGLLFLFSIISFLHEVEKRIVISYSSNIVYENKGEIGLKQILPIKLMPASVMPVIFTSTLFSLPLLIGAFAEGKDLEWVKFFNTAFWFNPDNIVYSIGCVAYILLIFIFSYFYINVFLNPYEIAEDLQKAGGLINGLKTNTDVAEYLKKHIYTMTLWGAIILSIISIIPFILSGMIGLSQMSFLGTSVLIIVSTTIETYKDIKSSRIVESHINKTGGLFDDKIKN